MVDVLGDGGVDVLLYLFIILAKPLFGTKHSSHLSLINVILIFSFPSYFFFDLVFGVIRLSFIVVVVIWRQWWRIGLEPLIHFPVCIFVLRFPCELLEALSAPPAG